MPPPLSMAKAAAAQQRMAGANPASRRRRSGALGRSDASSRDPTVAGEARQSAAAKARQSTVGAAKPQLRSQQSAAHSPQDGAGSPLLFRRVASSGSAAPLFLRLQNQPQSPPPLLQRFSGRRSAPPRNGASALQPPPLSLRHRPLHQAVQHQIPQQHPEACFLRRQPRQRPPAPASVVECREAFTRKAFGNSPAPLQPHGCRAPFTQGSAPERTSTMPAQLLRSR